MIYNDYKGLKLSAMGLGCMRLPVIDGDDAKVDSAAFQQMVDYAMAHGVNYYDTAWGYHGGNSETEVGKALAKYPRDRFYLATKFPGYDVSNFGKEAEIFEKQLQKCQVDYFDFYLLHNINESNIEQYLDSDKYHTREYFLRQRAEGRIKHLGFSVHGDFETFKRFMDVYGDDMEFCQIQLNYEDWEFQDAKAKVDYLNQHGIAIWVMEPLRGGNLIQFTDAEQAKLDAIDPGMSAVEWAYRYVENVPGVTVTLSGASSMDQLKQNIGIFSTEKKLSPEAIEALEQIGYDKAHAKGVPCTACHYCVSHCPMELDIPELLALYNEHVSKPDGGFIAPMKISSMPEDKHPSACIGCGSCEAVCPQQIAIPDTLAEFAEMLGE